MNRDFGKVSEGTMTFAKSYLRLKTVESVTWTDEDGNETVHSVERPGPLVMNPSAEQYQQMGYLPNEFTEPSPPDGHHVKSRRWDSDGERNFIVYEYESDALAKVVISKSKVERAIDAMGKTGAFQAWLYSKAQYVGDWLRGGDTVVYDPTDNASDLLSMMAALGLSAEEMPALIASVAEEEA